MNTLDDLLEKLWAHYSSVNKQSYEIHAMLESKGETVVNDHIAFRTFNIPKVGIDAVAKTFLNFGYKEEGSYEFKAKKLDAKHYRHPDGKYPLIFISELKIEEFSEDVQKIITQLVDAIPDDAVKQWDFPAAKVLWPPVSFADYEKLRLESEYAAWLVAFGYCANHFTVLINSLENYNDLKQFNDLLKANNFLLNDSGGEIKGSTDVYLEQSSTRAAPTEVPFSDGTKTIPCCYYEFAKRYTMPDGKLFTGFIAQSADKIFESTDNK